MPATWKCDEVEESYRDYRNLRKMERLVKRTCYRLQREEMEPLALFACLQQLLRIPERVN